MALALLVGGGVLYLYLAPQSELTPMPQSPGFAATPQIPLLPPRGGPMPGMPGMPGGGRTFAIVDLNVAPRSALLTLPGMTSDYADKIIAGRPFRGRDDLERAGIPRDVFERMSPPAMIRYVETGPPEGPKADAPRGIPPSAKP